ncbi:MAG: hypothetical protein ABI793_03390, partial [Flavobacterium sp.]
QKFEAINDYLAEILKDKTKEIIIIKEKITPNETLRLFQGNNVMDTLGHSFERYDGGVPVPLYNSKEFLKMKKKYEDTVSSINLRYLSNNRWNPEDFKYNKIVFENWEDVYLKMQKASYPRKPEIQIFAFSEPIYYKGKKYLVVTVSQGDTNSSGLPNTFVIVMKKIKRKWVVINETGDYIMN